MYKVVLASALVAVAASAPAGGPAVVVAPKTYGPPPTVKAYGPPVVKAYGPKVAYKEPELPPQPFAYEYGVNDDYSKANFKKAESQSPEGIVQGSYTVALPDGRIQTVTYTADEYNGFVADVTYEGTPVYPPEPAGGYGNGPVVRARPAVVAHAPLVAHAPVVARAPIVRARPAVIAPVVKTAKVIRPAVLHV